MKSFVPLPATVSATYTLALEEVSMLYLVLSIFENIQLPVAVFTALEEAKSVAKEVVFRMLIMEEMVAAGFTLEGLNVAKDTTVKDQGKFISVRVWGIPYPNVMSAKSPTSSTLPIGAFLELPATVFQHTREQIKQAIAERPAEMVALYKDRLEQTIKEEFQMQEVESGETLLPTGPVPEKYGC